MGLSSAEPKAIIVTSETRLEQLKSRFNNIAQAKFFIKQSKKIAKSSNISQNQVLEDADVDFDRYEVEDVNYRNSLEQTIKNLRGIIKTKVVQRAYITNYLFDPKDIVIVIGRDGLVANTAKYAAGNPIIGVNPDSHQYDGILLPFNPSNLVPIVKKVIRGNYRYKMVTMAEAKLNDGQRLLAFNDLFIGPKTHVSARYRLSFHGQSENHSSSGIIVSTGAGSTGWLSSLFNMAKGIGNAFLGRSEVNQITLEWDTNELIFIVREPFSSKTTQVTLAAGRLSAKSPLIIESQMPENGIIFSDGIQSDYLQFNSGSIATIGIAKEKAKLVLG